MVEFTKEAIWKTEYDMEIQRKEQKERRSSKILAVGLIALATTLAINLILIYNFFSLLNKI